MASRRDFLKTQLIAGASIPFVKPGETIEKLPVYEHPIPDAELGLDLSPASWIWMNVGRTLPNTILQFRKSFRLSELPATASGWIMADSRYRLWVNGQYLQFGPAPSDPRWAEADPVDIRPYLTTGDNVIGVEVLYYGFGDGTWPIGKPGLISRIELGDDLLITDESWTVQVARAWRPGMYKRWYLRAFQEEFDARKYDPDWASSEYDDSAWMTPIIIPRSSPTQPSIASASRDYLYNSGGSMPHAQLRKRSIAMLEETELEVDQLEEVFQLTWKESPDTFFEFRTPEEGMFEAVSWLPSDIQFQDGWKVPVDGSTAMALSFTMKEQVVGFPVLEIEASEGTIVEILVHEAHETEGPCVLLNTHFNAWTRLICKAGINRFQCFDYESVKWIQLHVRNHQNEVTIRKAGVRRRVLPFPTLPEITTNDSRLQTLFAACVNTILNQSQETIVDGMGRERQQYSGDIGHVIHPLLAGFGESNLVKRFCNTFSQGLTTAGYFLDCWPAFDRLARIMERELGMTEWGPLLDHGVGFTFDVYHYYLHTGDLDGIREVYPRLKVFYHYLLSIKGEDGLIPVEGLGVPVVWIDHMAYQQQADKHCAFNLYIAGMMKVSLPVLARAFGEDEFALEVEREGGKLTNKTNSMYWSPEHQTYLNDRKRSPLSASQQDDRSLAMALLYELHPESPEEMVKILADKPESLGLSYAPNAIWRFWALAKYDRIDVLLAEWREIWIHMPSIAPNNTMGEFFGIHPDGRDQWSHASVAPLICLYTSILGIEPVEPGGSSIRMRPQLGDLEMLKTRYETSLGTIMIDLTNDSGAVTGSITFPEGVTCELTINGETTQVSESWTA